jgi:hypothetical protein
MDLQKWCGSVWTIVTWLGTRMSCGSYKYANEPTVPEMMGKAWILAWLLDSQKGYDAWNYLKPFVHKVPRISL